MREPPGVVRRFFDWYLALGAERIILFLDDPAQEDEIRALSADPRIRLVPCTPAFWESLGMTQDTVFTRRQNRALTHAYHELCDSDFLLNVDGDELMFFPERSIGDTLASLPEDVKALRIRTAEQVHVPHAPGIHFRLPVTAPQVTHIYGAEADMFRPRLGLVGHADGKSFIRTGLPRVRLRQHWANQARERMPDLFWGSEHRVYLLHFAAPDFDAWRDKMLWRAGASGFTAGVKQRVERILAAGAREEDLAALYRSMFELSPERTDQLRAVNGLLTLDQGDLIPPVT